MVHHAYQSRILRSVKHFDELSLPRDQEGCVEVLLLPTSIPSNPNKSYQTQVSKKQQDPSRQPVKDVHQLKKLIDIANMIPTR